jgi:hypothetical protein
MASSRTGKGVVMSQTGAKKTASAADRILTPSVKPNNGLTRSKISKAVAAVMADRHASSKKKY